MDSQTSEKGEMLNKFKRKNYKRELNNNGIDTLSGDVKGCKSPTKEISINFNQCNYKTKEDSTYIYVNPNKSRSGEKLINSYGDFVVKMDGILKDMGVDPKEFNLSRVDFCFNSTNPTNFTEYQKFHRLIISCLAKAYKYKNCYVTCDLWDFEKLSVAIKKDDSEIENYNKRRQSEGKDESANRLELRSKRLRDSGDYREVIPYQFMFKWFERFDRAIKCFDEVQTEYNNHLERLYRDDKARPCKDQIYTSLTSFLLTFKECIYTRRQMIDLLSRLQDIEKYSNPSKKADKFKEKHRIEYFSKGDLVSGIEVLRGKVEEYFRLPPIAL